MGTNEKKSCGYCIDCKYRDEYSTCTNSKFSDLMPKDGSNDYLVYSYLDAFILKKKQTIKFSLDKGYSCINTD